MTTPPKTIDDYLEQLQAARIMNEYRDWIEYDEDNDINIANAYKTLTAH